MNFAGRLKEARKRCGYSYDELVYRAQIPYAKLWAWENKDRAPTLNDELIGLAVALETSPAWLFFGVTETMPLEAQPDPSLAGATP